MAIWAHLLLIVGLVLAPWRGASADLVVVVGARSGVQSLTRDEVINIFLGRYRQLPSGIPAEPVDQPESAPDRARFYRLLVNKELPEINAYWARLMFSGKAGPPRLARSLAEVKDWLVSQRGGIGYMDSSQVDARFQVVLDLGP